MPSSGGDPGGGGAVSCLPRRLLATIASNELGMGSVVKVPLDNMLSNRFAMCTKTLPSTCFETSMNLFPGRQASCIRERRAKGCTIFAAAVEDALAIASRAVPTSRARRERPARRELRTEVSTSTDFSRLPTALPAYRKIQGARICRAGHRRARMSCWRRREWWRRSWPPWSWS
jgi:hypothetical protein